MERAEWYTHSLGRRQAVLTDTVNQAQMFSVSRYLFLRRLAWVLFGELRYTVRAEEVTQKPTVFAEETPGPCLVAV